MTITVFTSNQPRHLSLIESLAKVADRVYAVMECNTVFPGKVADFFKRSEVMQRYFARVMEAERKVFGQVRATPTNASTLALKMGDLAFLGPADLGDAMNADRFVVFGSSYLKGALCSALVERGAINIHMGISPQYRGSSCNFWALYDGKPELVGATLHLLTAGLDSGPMLRHALPAPGNGEAFELGMRAVAAAHAALIDLLRTPTDAWPAPVPQDRSQQIRYTRNADFTDDVADAYLKCMPSAEWVRQRVADRSLAQFLRPHIGESVSA